MRYIYPGDWVLYKNIFKKAPHFRLGVVLSSTGIQENFMVDFGDDKIEKVSKDEVLEVRGPEESR
jgi:hypothetical protein